MLMISCPKYKESRYYFHYSPISERSQKSQFESILITYLSFEIKLFNYLSFPMIFYEQIMCHFFAKATKYMSNILNNISEYI